MVPQVLKLSPYRSVTDTQSTSYHCLSQYVSDLYRHSDYTFMLCVNQPQKFNIGRVIWPK